MPKAGHWAIALVCVVLGFLLAMQFKAQMRAQAPGLNVERGQEALQRLARVEQERQDLQAQVAELRGRIDSLVKHEAAYNALSVQLNDLELAAAVVPVTGPGVRVVMEDSARPVKPGENPNAYILHDEDLLRVVNELRAANAEAISINGQRLTARSEIRCVGPTVTINGVRTAPPVNILAIGDPKILEGALNRRGGVTEYLGLWGIKMQVTQDMHVEVPAYDGPLAFQHARPIVK